MQARDQCTAHCFQAGNRLPGALLPAHSLCGIPGARSGKLKHLPSQPKAASEGDLPPLCATLLLVMTWHACSPSGALGASIRLKDDTYVMYLCAMFLNVPGLRRHVFRACLLPRAVMTIHLIAVESSLGLWLGHDGSSLS